MQRRTQACQVSAIAAHFHMQRRGRACPGLDMVRKMRQVKDWKDKDALSQCRVQRLCAAIDAIKFNLTFKTHIKRLLNRSVAILGLWKANYTTMWKLD